MSLRGWKCSFAISLNPPVMSETVEIKTRHTGPQDHHFNYSRLFHVIHKYVKFILCTLCFTCHLHSTASCGAVSYLHSVLCHSAPSTPTPLNPTFITFTHIISHVSHKPYSHVKIAIRSKVTIFILFMG